ncbi:MAG: hypothetical protein V1844_00370 [Pseudomonadota bacterium]
MIEFVEAHLGLITLLLTLATFWLGFSTRQAAKASNAIYMLESRPFLTFNKPVFRMHRFVDKENPNNVKNQLLKIGVEFSNPSKVPVKYRMKRVFITFDSHTVEQPKFVTTGGIIYPGGFGIYWYDKLQYKEIFEAPKQGMIEYELEYFSTDIPKKYKKFEKMNYLLTSLDPFSCDWHYTEEVVDEPI